MSTIRCKAKLLKIGSANLVRLPKNASAKLPSRGMVMVAGTINRFDFQAPLEPDGKGSHWFRVDTSLRQAAKAIVGDTVTLVMASVDDWPEPKVPADLQRALVAAPAAHATWKDATPKARWEWIRWIRSTKSAETRQRRIKVASSKLKAGNRRPCCFNSSACAVPDVSDGGVLRESTQ